jgi:hypothetical protein
MHFKRTSASQTPNTRNLMKPFNLKNYLKNPKKEVKNLEKTNKEIFNKFHNIGNDNKKVIVYNANSSKNTKTFEICDKSETNSISGNSVNKKILRKSKNYLIENKSPEIIKSDHSRRWKIMKSVDLKAKKGNYPRQERIRIIKSPPPNVILLWELWVFLIFSFILLKKEGFIYFFY